MRMMTAASGPVGRPSRPENRLGTRFAPQPRRLAPRPSAPFATRPGPIATTATTGRRAVRAATVAAAAALAIGSILVAGVIAAQPSPTRTQSFGAPQVSAYVDDGRTAGEIAFDTGVASERIDPATYETTPVRGEAARVASSEASLRWTTHWPKAWTEWSSFVEIVLAAGFMTIGGVFAASTLAPEDDGRTTATR